MILDGYPSNEKFIVYGTPSIRSQVYGLFVKFIKPSNITGYWTVIILSLLETILYM